MKLKSLQRRKRDACKQLRDCRHAEKCTEKAIERAEKAEDTIDRYKSKISHLEKSSIMISKEMEDQGNKNRSLMTELRAKDRVTKNLKDEMELLEVRIKESQEELQRERAKVADVKKSGRVSKKTVEALKEETQRLQEKFINASNQLKRQADEIVQLEENVRATEEENRTLRMAAENARRTCNDIEASLQSAAKERKELEFTFKEKIEKSKIEMKGEWIC